MLVLLETENKSLYVSNSRLIDPKDLSAVADMKNEASTSTAKRRSDIPQFNQNDLTKRINYRAFLNSSAGFPNNMQNQILPQNRSRNKRVFTSLG